jgi:signal transduction histidine kinase
MLSLSKKGQQILYQHRGKEAEVLLDQELVRNILINLLSNAIKYSPSDREIHVLTEVGASHIQLSVMDRGIGIPETDKRHLFERFFRANNATTIPGTGLGLNIVKRYLDLMGGTIEFESEENTGTTFKVTLPREIKP